MSSPLISISVPVYNAERYLRQCLDSLVRQTLRDIEIVVVNDGSTDSSESIIREYAERDSRIVLICKENGGLASARQAALEAAHGLYFCACDADDWVEPDMYEKLYRKAVETNADIVMCDYWSEYPNGKQVASCYGKEPMQQDDLLDDALNGLFPPQVWSKIFKRSLFSRLSLSWEPGINLGEDFLLMRKILRYRISIAYLPISLYHYRRELGGSTYTNSITMETLNQSLFIRQWVMSHVAIEKYSNGLFRLWLNFGFTALRVKDGMTGRFYREEILCHVPYYGFLTYRYPILKGGLVLSAKLLGYRFSKFIYEKVYKYVYH